MSIASLDQVKSMLRGMLGITNRDIARAQGDATKAVGVANAAREGVASKMNANNPVGTGSFSMGRLAGSAEGESSHAEGGWSVASGDYSHAEGCACHATGKYSHAEGYSTIASGDYSHAEGNATASGKHSHAESKGNAVGDYSHAEGSTTCANGNSSHAEGNSTTANGDYSHAEGQDTIATGMRSHAEGYHTIAAGIDQHVQGKYNIQDPDGVYAHIVGNGHYAAYEGVRSNAHTLDWEGNAWYAGYVEGTSLILPSPDGTRWKITVNNDGTLNVANAAE